MSHSNQEKFGEAVSHRNTMLRMKSTVRFAREALRHWAPRQWRFAAVVSLAFGVLIGVVTVLIPNPIFARDIEPVWWNYPVLLVTSILTGLLVTTYLRPPMVESTTGVTQPSVVDSTEKHSTRMGMVGSLLAWFAVGCPVCNKIAVIALGYSGAITWFAPVQPFLALAAVLLTGIALLWRLSGQVACPMPAATARKLETL